ncbi:MAG TPA: NUDIX domain-containing protein [Candidatus Kapabacteria bacterium]|nr:NUDIX domain-containing protein [Candidatus Kapabacteria bacterium]
MTPVEVVTALLVDNGKVLMCERHEKKLYPLHWEFPGGKVEPGESLVEALIREVYEELQVNCNAIREYFDDVMTYSNGITYHVTFFIVPHFSGKPVNTEFNSIGSFSVEELKQLQHLSGNSNILAKLYTEGIPSE